MFECSRPCRGPYYVLPAAKHINIQPENDIMFNLCALITQSPSIRLKIFRLLFFFFFRLEMGLPNVNPTYLLSLNSEK